MSIKLTRWETWSYARKKEMEITPENFEEFKERFISCYLEKLQSKRYEVDEDGRKAWLEKAKAITFEELAKYINLEYINNDPFSWDIMKNYNVRTGRWSFYTIDEFCDFLDDLKDGWTYGEFGEGSCDESSLSYKIEGEK